MSIVRLTEKSPLAWSDSSKKANEEKYGVWQPTAVHYGKAYFKESSKKNGNIWNLVKCLAVIVPSLLLYFACSNTIIYTNFRYL